jgi:hypothetical protein
MSSTAPTTNFPRHLQPPPLENGSNIRDKKGGAKNKTHRSDQKREKEINKPEKKASERKGEKETEKTQGQAAARQRTQPHPTKEVWLASGRGAAG